jgi:hypothetical protein
MMKTLTLNRLLLGLTFTALLVSACVGPTEDPAPETTRQAVQQTEQNPDLDETLTPTATQITETPTVDPQGTSGTATPVKDTATPRPTSTPRSYGPDNFPDSVNPLTGLPVDDPELLERRPIGVKIQLYPRAGRPPWGVSLADLVFDFYQNDGLTRLHAVFYGNDAETVGPIRSARLFDENIMRMYKSIFAYGGADWRVLNRIYDYDLIDLMVVEGKYNCPPMCRLDPNAANYLVTNTGEIQNYIDTEREVENDRQNLDGMSFDFTSPGAGLPGQQIEVRWSISAYLRWVYDDDSGLYLREQDNLEAYTAESEEFSPFTDRLTEEQISAANVVVIPLIHEDIYPTQNIEVVDIKLSGSGEAYLFRDGQMYRVQWNRPAADSVLFLTDEEGNRMPYKPGNTWFEIIGNSSQVSEPDQGVWRYEFRYP